MLPHLSPVLLLVISILALGCYYLIIAKTYGKHFVFSLYKLKPSSIHKITAVAGRTTPHNLIDISDDPAGVEVAEQDEPTDEDLSFLELVKDEESVLLIEAEQVVDKINGVIQNIASRPPNPQEVTSKLNSLLKDYRFFENTEYFDAINSFVAVTAERDCEIKYSAEDLRALWN